MNENLAIVEWLLNIYFFARLLTSKRRIIPLIISIRNSRWPLRFHLASIVTFCTLDDATHGSAVPAAAVLRDRR